MSLRQISIDEYCPTLTYEFRVKNLRDTQLIEILIISFHGCYRDGSAGTPDAGLIKGIIKTGVSVFGPLSVLIDLRELEYNWGDDFDLSFQETDYTTTAVLVGEKCRRAMSTLSFGLNTPKDVVDNVLFFDDFDKAIEQLKRKLKEMMQE